MRSKRAIKRDAMHTRQESARCLVEEKRIPRFSICRTGFSVRREFEYVKFGKKTEEIAYGIARLSKEKAEGARLLQLNRGHKNAPRVMSSLKPHMSLGILRL